MQSNLLLHTACVRLHSSAVLVEQLSINLLRTYEYYCIRIIKVRYGYTKTYEYLLAVINRSTYEYNLLFKCIKQGGEQLLEVGYMRMRVRT